MLSQWGIVGRASASLAHVARAAAKGGRGTGRVNPAKGRSKPVDDEAGFNESKYRLHVQTIFPAKARDAAPIDFAEKERRTQIAKIWSRYQQRLDHIRLREEQGLIESQRHAVKVMTAMDAQLVADIRQKSSVSEYVPAERMSATWTPPTKDPTKKEVKEE